MQIVFTVDAILLRYRIKKNLKPPIFTDQTQINFKNEKCFICINLYQKISLQKKLNTIWFNLYSAVLAIYTSI